MTRIFITRRLHPLALELLLEHFEVNVHDENSPLPVEAFSEIVREYDGVLSTVIDRFDETLLRQRKKLQVISNYAIGLDNIDVDYARANGVAVYNTPDVVTEPTADMTFALLLALERKVGPAFEFIKQDQWRSWDPWLFLGRGLTGKVMGIHGFGRIGQAVGRRAVGFGMKVVYHDVQIREVNDPLLAGAEAVDLDQLLERCHYLSIHVPLNKATRGLFNRQLLSRVRQRPILLNMARGPVVDTEALVFALQEGWLRGAALDVTDPEPLSGSAPICKLENVIISPHIGTATEECRRDMAEVAAQNLIRHFTS